MYEKVVWLTGSRGFIGRPLVSALKKSFSRVICFTNRRLDESLPRQENDCLYMDYSNSADIKAQVEKATEICKNSPTPTIDLIHTDVWANGGSEWHN